MSPTAAGTRWQRLRRFLGRDVWDMDLSSLSSLRRMGVTSIRVLQLIFRGFVRDECPLHASALTFSSLMAVVPVLAISLALARGLGGAETVKAKLRGAIADWSRGFQTESAARPPAAETPPAPAEETMPAFVLRDAAAADEFAARLNAVVDQAFERVDRVSFTAIGGIGLVCLLFMVVQVLGQVEASFNKVWGVSVGRPFWRKFTDYFSVLLILPVFMVAASSLPLAGVMARLSGGTPAWMRAWLDAEFLRQATVLLTTGLAFTFLLMLMPNTKVRFRPAFAGGVVTAALFLGWIWLCRALQIGVAGYGKIYGSFAMLPIILAWGYVSWGIVLFGAEVAFGIQNCNTYRMESGAHEASVEARLMLALAVALEAARAMAGAAPTFEVAAFARAKRVPVRFLNEIVNQLVQASLLGELSQAAGHFVLLRPPACVSVREVLDSVLRSGVGPADLGVSRLNATAGRLVASLTGGSDGALGRMTLQELAESHTPAEVPSGDKRLLRGGG